jgi:hypothetical protein
MEGHCSTGQSPQWALVPMEEEEEVAGTVTRQRARGSGSGISKSSRPTLGPTPSALKSVNVFFSRG